MRLFVVFSICWSQYHHNALQSVPLELQKLCQKITSKCSIHNAHNSYGVRLAETKPTFGGDKEALKQSQQQISLAGQEHSASVMANLGTSNPGAERDLGCEIVPLPALKRHEDLLLLLAHSSLRGKREKEQLGTIKTSTYSSSHSSPVHGELSFQALWGRHFSAGWVSKAQQFSSSTGALENVINHQRTENEE